MEKCTIFLPILNPKNESKITNEKWDEAIKYYKKSEFKKVIPTIIEYIDKDLVRYKTDTGYTIPHGSIILEITLTDTEFKVNCPFINIKGSKKTPLMRKIAELRLNPLDLVNITLKNENAVFAYSCPLELCEPQKIYDLLKEICIFADKYDDEFIQKFNAKHIQEPKIKHLDSSKKEEIYSNMQKIIDDNISRLDYYVSKRDGRKAWCTLNIIFKQLEFYVHPQGYLRTEIERFVDDIHDRNMGFHDLVLKAKENLLKIKNYNKDKFMNNLYSIEVFVPYKYSGRRDNIKENWAETYNNVKELLKNNDHETACIEMLSLFYNLFYYNNVSDEIGQPIMEAMNNANNKNWIKASEQLFKGIQSVMEERLNERIFGMDISVIMRKQIKNTMDMIKKMMNIFQTNK